MKAKEFTKQINAPMGSGKNYTGLKFATMTGKLQDLKIAIVDGVLCFIRKSGTIVKDYSEKEVLYTMEITGKKIGETVKMRSCSTSMLLNTHCIERYEKQDPDCICTHCFSCATLSGDNEKSRGMQRNLKANTDILCNGFLDWKKIPVINDDFFRFESHGDLMSAIQLVNYILICEKALETGSNCKFALWSKNPWYLETVFVTLGIEKPENLQIQLSSPYLNTIAPVPAALENIVDRVFTVWTDKATADAAGVCLNCCNGVRKHTYCIGCTNCYVKNNGVAYVNELLRK